MNIGTGTKAPDNSDFSVDSLEPKSDTKTAVAQGKMNGFHKKVLKKLWGLGKKVKDGKTPSLDEARAACAATRNDPSNPHPQNISDEISV